jgi:hypothetical protein
MKGARSIQEFHALKSLPPKIGKAMAGAAQAAI